MPSQRFSNTMIAAEVIQNILAGSQFEFVGVPSRIQIYTVTDVANTGNLEVTFGQELQIPSSPIGTGGVGLGPVVPDDLLIDDIAAPGDRLVLRLVAGGAGAVVRTLVVITPLA